MLERRLLGRGRGALLTKLDGQHQITMQIKGQNKAHRLAGWEAGRPAGFVGFFGFFEFVEEEMGGWCKNRLSEPLSEESERQGIAYKGSNLHRT